MLVALFYVEQKKDVKLILLTEWVVKFDTAKVVVDSRLRFDKHVCQISS